MNFTKDLIDDLASKLLFELSDEENKMVLDEFEEIERNMNLINDIGDICKIEPLTHPFPLESTVLREDDEVFELRQEEVLQNAQDKNLTSVIVPKVVGE